MNYPIRFAEQLRQHLKSLRRARGLTQAALGAQLGVSQARIAELEANPGLVSMEQMLQVFSALGVNMSLNEDPAQSKLKTQTIAIKRNSKVVAEPTSMQYYGSGNSIDMPTLKFKMPLSFEMKRVDSQGGLGEGVSPKITSAMTREEAVMLAKKHLKRTSFGANSVEDLKGLRLTNSNRFKKGSW
jgi:transcriptional regulator with XRE-family HTH domain